MSPLAKRIAWPAIALLLHNLVENWPPIVALLGPHFAWLAGPAVVAVLVAVVHELQPPGQTPPGQ